MDEPQPTLQCPSSDAVTIWTSRPQHWLDWLFVSVKLLTLWTVVIGMFVTVAIAPKTETLHYIMLAGGGLIALPVAVINSLPMLRSYERRISIDEAARVVYFENVYLHKAFQFPSRARCYVCSFDDILWVQFSRSHRASPEWLTITTKAGRIFLSSHSNNLRAASAVLSPLALNRKVPISKASWLPAAIGGTIVFVGLFVAFAMGWLP